MKDMKENFTQVNNKLLEAMAYSDFSAREYKILLALIRLTLGYHRRSAEISVGTLAKMTHLDRSNVSKSLSLLIEKQVIRIYKEHTASSAREIGLNLILPQWVKEIPEVPELPRPAEDMSEVHEVLKEELTGTATTGVDSTGALVRHNPEEAVKADTSLSSKRPSVEDCIKYFEEFNETKEFGELFFYKHESTNWKDGNERTITNWKSRARQCMLNPTLRNSILGADENGKRKGANTIRSNQSGIEFDKYQELYNRSQSRQAG